MNQVLKSLGAALRSVYGTIVLKPMPWRMIDRLATLEETCEREDKPRDTLDTRPSATNGHLSEPSKPGAPKQDL